MAVVRVVWIRNLRLLRFISELRIIIIVATIILIIIIITIIIILICQSGHDAMLTITTKEVTTIGTLAEAKHRFLTCYFSFAVHFSFIYCTVI